MAWKGKIALSDDRTTANYGEERCKKKEEGRRYGHMVQEEEEEEGAASLEAI